MRRLIATAALAALVATGSACDSSSISASGSSATPSTSTSTTPSTGTGSGSADTKQVCADARAVITNSTGELGSDLQKVITAAASGDKAKQDSAVSSLRDLFNRWSTGLREQAGKTSNADLKAALTTYADKLATVASEVKTFADLDKANAVVNSPEVADANKKITELCS
jgi:hypothetical protein